MKIKNLFMLTLVVGLFESGQALSLRLVPDSTRPTSPMEGNFIARLSSHLAPAFSSAQRPELLVPVQLNAISDVTDICSSPDSELVQLEKDSALVVNSALLKLTPLDWYLRQGDCVPFARVMQAVQRAVVQIPGVTKDQNFADSVRQKQIDYVGFGPFELDLLSLSSKTVALNNPCGRGYQADAATQDGVPLKGLGFAVVYMEAGYNTSILGHIGARFIYCRGDQLADVLLEFTQVMDSDLPHFKVQHPDYAEGRTDAELTQNLVGKYFVNLTFNPATFELYGLYQQAANRNIFEYWLPVNGAETLRNMRWMMSLYHQQGQQLKDNQTLPNYQLLSKNCLSDLSQHLGLHDLTPQGLYNDVRAQHSGGRQILYPSQRIWRILERLQVGQDIADESVMSSSEASQSATNVKRIFIEERNPVARPFAAVINFFQALFAMVIDVIKLPFVGVVPVIADAGRAERAIPQFVGLPVGYPAPTPWRDDETAKISASNHANVPTVWEWIGNRWSEPSVDGL